MKKILFTFLMALYLLGATTVLAQEKDFSKVELKRTKAGGNALNYEKHVEEIISQLSNDVVIIPGHGPISTLKDLKAFHQMLVSTIASVHTRMDAGKTLDEIKQEGLDKKWESWAKGFINEEKWIEIIHASITQN